MPSERPTEEVEQIGLDVELWRYKIGVVDVILHEWAEGSSLYTTDGTAETPLEAAEHDGPAVKDTHYRDYVERDDGLIAGHHPNAGRRETHAPTDEFDEPVTLLTEIKHVE